MSAPGLVGPTPHDTIIKPACSIGADSSGFLSGRSPSDTSYAERHRTVYLSPPMSGSPSPDSRLDPSRGTRRRQRSSSPAPLHATQHTTTVTGYSISNIKDVLNHEAEQPSPHRTSVPQIGVSLPTGTPVSQQSTMGTSTSAGQAAPLPPRPTRRTKAHVASACVNCKQKHLGCDSARPCRRCVIAGKEASCVDVTHKRRGRPPLKAEEGPLRHYESKFNQPVAPRVLPQSHSTAFGQRYWVSREIAPMPGLTPHAPSDPRKSYSNTWKTEPLAVHSPSQTTSTPVVLPQVGISATPLPTVAPSRHGPLKGYSPTGVHSFAFKPDIKSPELTRRLSDSVSSLRRYPAEQQINFLPSSHLPHRSPLPGHSDVQAMQRPSTTGGLNVPPLRLPSLSEFRLPPILPSSSSLSNDERPTHLATATQRFTSQQWSHPESQNLGTMDMRRSQSYTQLPGGVSIDQEMRTFEPQLQRHPLLSPPSLSYGHSATSRAQSDTFPLQWSLHANPRASLKEDESDARPTKRQKMELGEMVND
ncbi:hypothetical protein VTO42DRAFT_8530 [Malbranchea cinnamomea]